MYYERNQQALLQAASGHAALFAQLDAFRESLLTEPAFSEAEQMTGQVVSHDDFELIALESGQYTLRYRNVLLHDPENPLQEARQAFRKSCKSGADRVHLIINLGLGYALDEVFQNSPGPIVIYEPDLRLLNFALENVELVEMLASGRVQIVTNHFDLVSQLRPRIYSDFDIDVLMLKSAETLLGADVPAVVQLLRNMIGDWARDYRTISRFHLQWVEQFFQNYPHFAEVESIESLVGRFQDRPALVISRGPSLDRDADTVKKLEKSAVLIAVGSAVRRLYQADVTPDFAVFYDANGLDEQVKGLPAAYLSQITFILCPSTAPLAYSIPSRGKFVFFSQNGKQMCDWMDKAAGKTHARLEGGGTVSLLALQLALIMGCGPIALVGQDLAFPNNQVYAEGVPLTLNSDGHMHLPASDTLFTAPTSLTQVKGQNGEMLTAATSYAGFIRHFEALANRERKSPTPVTLYNTSIGGAHLEGYTLRPLESFLESFPVWKSGHALEQTASLSAKVQGEKRHQLTAALSALIAETRDTVQCFQTLLTSLPASTVSDKTLENALWENTQRLFIHLQKVPFVGYFCMFEIIPYKQRFKAFADAENFNPAIRADFEQALLRASALLNTAFLPWMEKARQTMVATSLGEFAVAPSLSPLNDSNADADESTLLRHADAG